MKSRNSERIEFINSDGSAQVFDLSSTGIAVLHPVARTTGDVLSVQINDLTVSAKVVYSVERTDGFRLGMQFQGVSMELQKKIAEEVEKFSKGVPISCRVADSAREKAKT